MTSNPANKSDAQNSGPGNSTAPLPFQFEENPADFHAPEALVVRVPRGIRSKQKLLAILADKLRFPAYFGHNWDALEECLGDLSWLSPGQKVVIVHDDLPFGPGGENRQVYFDILAAVAPPERALQIVLPKED